jgi:hypothetical protein
MLGRVTKDRLRNDAPVKLNVRCFHLSFSHESIYTKQPIFTAILNRFCAVRSEGRMSCCQLVENHLKAGVGMIVGGDGSHNRDGGIILLGLAWTKI